MEVVDCFFRHESNCGHVAVEQDLCPYVTKNDAEKCAHYCTVKDVVKETSQTIMAVPLHNDPVNHPSHYTAGGIECIDAIAAALTSQNDPMSAWLTGQCLKYLWRWPLKNGLEDLKKTRFYLDRLIKHEEEKK